MSWKVIAIIFITLFLVGTVSASWEYDNRDDYDEITKTYNITNFFDLGHEIATVTLVSPEHNIVIIGGEDCPTGEDCLVMEYDVDMFDDEYIEALEEVEWFNIKNDMREFEREFTYKYGVAREIGIDEHETICDEKVLANGSLMNYNCQEIFILNRKETVYDWYEFEEAKLMKGVTKVGIFTDVIAGEHTEMIPSFLGIRAEEWTDFEAYTRYEFFDPTDNIASLCQANYAGQNFTVGNVSTNEDFLLRGISVVLSNATGDVSNTANISICTMGADGCGTVLAINDSVPTALGGDEVLSWVNASFDGSVTLSASTVYMIVVKNHGACATGRFEWHWLNAAGYDAGISSTGGDEYDWGESPDRDFGFQIFGELAASVETTLDTPTNDTITTATVNFIINSSATALTLDTANLFIWNSTNDEIHTNLTEIAGTSNTTTMSYTFASDGNYTWNGYINDTTGVYTDWGDANWTVTIDTTEPSVVLTSPNETYGQVIRNDNLSLNWTVSDAVGLDTCWFEYNNTNTTLNCADNNYSFSTEYGKQITFYVNDTIGNENSTTTSWNYEVFEADKTFSVEAFELTTQDYTLNLSSDGVQEITANLYYNGTAYTTTKTGDNNEMLFTKNLTLLSGTTGTLTTNEVFWEILRGVAKTNSSFGNQTMNLSLLSYCNASIGVPYVNFSYVDEESLTRVNGTVDTSTWTYWMDDDAVTKELVYANATPHDTHAFCFVPPYRNVIVDLVKQFAASGYPQRRFAVDNSILTNGTSATTLYLLATADGIYSSYQVQDTAGSPIDAVTVTVERQFTGVWTTVNQDNTGSDGIVTFWVNPDYDHRFTFSKSGYDTTILTIRPTQSIYTVVMGGSVAASNVTYTSYMEGIDYTINPRPGFIDRNTTYTFEFNITASSGNLVYYSMNLTNGTDLLASVFGTTATGSNLSIVTSTGYNKTIYGEYYIDIGNGIYLIDPSVWSIRTINAGNYSMKNFWENLRDDYIATDIDSHYTMLFFFFFVFFLLVAAFTRFSQVEMTNPAITLIPISCIIIIASVAGFFTIDFAPSTFINKFGIALVYCFFTFGIILSKWRTS